MVLNKLNDKGSILIFALWTIIFLTVLAVQIGLIIRQRVSLLSRIERNEHMRDIASSGVKKALSAIQLDLLRNGGLYTVYGKAYRHHNRELFKDIVLFHGHADILYDDPSHAEGEAAEKYGFVDEERKINLNTADYTVLKRLFELVLDVRDEDAQRLALNILDWRSVGESMPEGFNSDAYYGNLEFPYEKKSAEFEIYDELTLVDGFTADTAYKLEPFITVYGDGLVNINTAPKEVLVALGLSEEVAGKLLEVRQGMDAEEATMDDYIFFKTFDIASEMKSFLELKEAEMKEIDALNAVGRVKTNSAYFKIRSVARLEHRSETLEAVCVFNARDEIIEYWRENN